VTNNTLPPRGLTRGVAIGLLLMAVFSVWWTSDTFYGWARPAAIVATVIGVGAAIFFAVRSIQLLRISRRLPEQADAPGQMAKSRGRVFGYVFGAEGAFIGIAVGILGANGLEEFVVPTIAVIVGLHFYPMAWVFQRSIDVWLASWTTLVGAAGIVAVAVDRPDALLVWAWVGAGVAVATLLYGTYMSRFAGQLLRRASAAPAMP
jgi:hypothetical protein